jgi:predicted RND superfamily exporter protein
MLTAFIQTIITRRLWVILLTLLLTGLSLFYATRLRIVIDPAAILPQSHPFVASKALLENVFGEHYTLMVAIEPKSGNPADPAVLQKIRRITDALKQDGSIVKSTLLSVAGQNAKAIVDTDEGFEVRPFATALNQPDKLLRWLDSNPLYRNAIVSEDGRMYAVLAQFHPDPHGYGAILQRVQPIIDRERDDSVTIYQSGHVNFLGQIELYSERMIILVPIAVVLIALLLFDAFRSVQGLLLPLLTANLALIWVLGIMGASGISLDVFNATTPILILAIAAGHAVQILKRYYEEYARLRTDTDLTPEQANREAVIVSVSKVGRYMIAASLIAAMGFLSLTVFEIRTVKTFGVFTGLGIVCALLIELTFMPALRSWLKPPPMELNRRSGGVWDAVIRYIVAVSPRRFVVFWLLVVGLAIIGAGQVRIGNSNKANFADWTTVRQEDAVINQRFGGTQTFYIMIDTGHADGIKNPAILNSIASLQRSLTQMPDVGKTVSIVDFLARMHQAMKSEGYLPDSAELAGQYLLLYSMSGDPDRVIALKIP